MSSKGREEWMKEMQELQEVFFGPMCDKRLDEMWIADASWMPELPAGVHSWCLWITFVLKSIVRGCAVVHLCQKGTLLDADSEMFLWVAFFWHCFCGMRKLLFPLPFTTNMHPYHFQILKSISINYINRGIFRCGGISQMLSLIW